ncbi:30S ribosomal protein S4 [Candidatus Solirubrobacter pratensis]|uniref:30S ribosomal protein S4 n=1 Tax=Candidatus Solirubrobacter pratensis TaxID=1298857 RepID=UPI00040184BD|nr:30S ribosomal protein S4 [Candidatus Solirubrobacter pratensis]
MGRYTGPVEKLSRREGVELYLKGERALNGKSALERRGPVPPGQHGAARRRRPSIYAEQLRAKQRAKRYYGVREKQFRNYVREAARNRERVTGEELLRLLERRLDNVVYRLGFASTRAQARQFVNHGHVTVDGRRVDIASYAVKPGQEIAIDSSSPVRDVASAMTELTGTVAGWLQTDFDGLSGKVLRIPERAEISAPVDEHLIVELYSRL